MQSSGNYGSMGAYGGSMGAGAPNERISKLTGSRDPAGSLSNLYKEHESTTKMNWKNLAAKTQSFKNITYQVTFRVKKELGHGQTLCVLGSLPELGNWKEYKHPMKWTDGDYWESITPLNTHCFYFQYKYSIFE